MTLLRNWMRKFIASWLPARWAGCAHPDTSAGHLGRWPSLPIPTYRALAKEFGVSLRSARCDRRSISATGAAPVLPGQGTGRRAWKAPDRRGEARRRAAHGELATFGAKREILSAICEKWLEDARARELAASRMAEPDPKKRLRRRRIGCARCTKRGIRRRDALRRGRDDDAETRPAARQARGRNQVMDAMIASLEGSLTHPAAASAGDLPGARRTRSLRRTRHRIGRGRRTISKSGSPQILLSQLLGVRAR